MLRRTAAAGLRAGAQRGLAAAARPLRAGRVAVLGPNAAVARTLGGGSATVYPPYTVSPLDGLRPRSGEVDHAVGVLASDRHRRSRDDADGSTASRSASWPPTAASCRPSSAPAPRSTGSAPSATAWPWPTSRASRRTPSCAPARRAPTRSAARASGATSWRSAGRRCSTAGSSCRPGADMVEGMLVPPQAVHAVELAAGEEVAVVLAHEVGSSGERHRRGVPAQPRGRRTAATTRRSRARSRSRARPTSRSSSSARPRRSRARASTARRSRSRAARTSSCGASPRPTRGRSWSSTPARRCCCRGPTTWRRSCSRGSPARSSATRSPTCCWASPSRAAGCRRRGPTARTACPRPQPADGVLQLRRGAARSATAHGRRGRATRSATASATRPGATTRSRRRPRPRPARTWLSACA